MADNVVQVIIRAKDEATQVVKGFEGSLKGLATAVVGLSAMATGLSVALWKIGESAAKRGEDMLAFSQKTNLSVEAMSRLQYAAELSETSVETLRIGLRFLQRNAVEAAAGGTEAAEGFSALGVSVKNVYGAMKGTRELLGEVAEVFARMKDGPEKAALAIKIFGRSGSELLPLLNEGAAGISKLEAEADRLGVTVSTTAAILGDQFGDSMARVKLQVEGLKMAIAEQLLPTMLDVTGGASDAVAKMREWTDAHGPLIRALAKLLRDLAPVTLSIVGLTAAIAGLKIAAATLGIALGGPVVIGIAIAAGALALLGLKAYEAREKMAALRVETALAATSQDAAAQSLLAAQRSLDNLRRKLAQARTEYEASRESQGPRLTPETLAKGNAVTELEQQVKGAEKAVASYASILDTVSASTARIEAPTDKLSKTMKKAAKDAREAAAEWAKVLDVLTYIAQNQPKVLGIKTLTPPRVPLAVSEELPVPPAPERRESPIEMWAEQVNLTNEELGDLIVSLETANGLVVGIAAGFEGFAKWGAEAFELTANAADATFRGMADLVEGVGAAFGEFADDVFLKGQNILQSLGDLMVGIGKLIQNVLSEMLKAFAAAIAQAIVFKMILRSLSAAASIAGVPFIGALIPGILSQGGMIKVATGGAVTPHGDRATGRPPLLRAASGLTVPGAVQVLDRVPALLSPGEVVLPVINGQSPAGVVTDLAALGRELKRSASEGQRVAQQPTNYVNINAFNLDALRDMLRHGDLQREQMRAIDLGRA